MENLCICNIKSNFPRQRAFRSLWCVFYRACMMSASKNSPHCRTSRAVLEMKKTVITVMTTMTAMDPTLRRNLRRCGTFVCADGVSFFLSTGARCTNIQCSKFHSFPHPFDLLTLPLFFRLHRSGCFESCCSWFVVSFHKVSEIAFIEPPQLEFTATINHGPFVGSLASKMQRFLAMKHTTPC